MTQLDFSEAAKLRDVVFRRTWPNVKWTSKALHTARSGNLQRVSLELPRHDRVATGEAIWETVREEWADLDHELVWTSHSLRPEVIYEPGKCGQKMRVHAAGLLPELTRRGIVDLVRLKENSAVFIVTSYSCAFFEDDFCAACTFRRLFRVLSLRHTVPRFHTDSDDGYGTTSPSGSPPIGIQRRHNDNKMTSRVSSLPNVQHPMRANNPESIQRWKKSHRTTKPRPGTVPTLNESHSIRRSEACSWFFSRVYTCVDLCAQVRTIILGVLNGPGLLTLSHRVCHTSPICGTV